MHNTNKASLLYMRRFSHTCYDLGTLCTMYNKAPDEEGTCIFKCSADLYLKYKIIFYQNDIKMSPVN